MSNPVGRPPKLTPKQKQELLQQFKEYIATNDDPTVVRFVSYNAMALELMVTRDDMCEWQEFSNLTKQAIAKQEAFLLDQTKNPTMAIFRLKQPQHGYKDRTEQAIDVTSKGEVIGAPIDPRLVAGWTEYLTQHTLSDQNTES